MKEQVVLTKRQWTQLPLLIAQHLHYHSRRSYGFKLVSRETGEEITDKVDMYLLGVVASEWSKIEESLERLGDA